MTRWILLASLFVGCSTPTSALSGRPTPGVAHTSLPLPPFGGGTAPHLDAVAMPAPPAPVATAAPPAEPPVADLDPDNDGVIAPPDGRVDCEQRLSEAGVRHRKGSIPVRAQAGGFSCGAPQIVIVEHDKGELRYNAEPVVSCGMALGLARLERILQQEAEAEFGSRVVRIEQGGTYSCRKMARYSLVSEHSYANAIDLYSFTLQDGRNVSVLKHYGPPDAEPATPEARFLRRVAHRAYDEGAFSVVLTPKFDALHKNHLHLDMARYRVDGSR